MSIPKRGKISHYSYSLTNASEPSQYGVVQKLNQKTRSSKGRFEQMGKILKWHAAKIAGKCTPYLNLAFPALLATGPALTMWLSGVSFASSRHFVFLRR